MNPNPIIGTAAWTKSRCNCSWVGRSADDAVVLGADALVKIIRCLGLLSKQRGVAIRTLLLFECTCRDDMRYISCPGALNCMRKQLADFAQSLRAICIFKPAAIPVGPAMAETKDGSWSSHISPRRKRIVCSQKFQSRQYYSCRAAAVDGSRAAMGEHIGSLIGWKWVFQANPWR